MTDTPLRTLVLARHARAEGGGASDEARELTAAGHADAAAMGRWLNRSGPNFDLVVCSTATRTRQTWTGVESGPITAGEVRFDERVYGGDAEALLELLADVPDDVERLLVIGHAPTIPELADLLADPDASDQNAVEALHSRFPSGCLGVLTLDCVWTALIPGGASLTEVATPRA